MYKFKAANNALFKGFQFSGARKRPWGNWAERVCLPWYTLVYHHHGIPWYTMDHGMYTTTMAPPPQILKIRSVLGRVTKKHPWTVSTPHTQIFQIGLSSSSWKSYPFSSSSTFESLILFTRVGKLCNFPMLPELVIDIIYIVCVLIHIIEFP